MALQVLAVVLLELLLQLVLPVQMVPVVVLAVQEPERLQVKAGMVS
jgi:hypothetical protein